MEPEQDGTMRDLYRHTIFMFISMFLISCNQLNSSYVISKEDSIRKVAHTSPDGIVLNPPAVKYAPYTFVIDSSNNIYFYSLMEERKDTGISDNEEPDSVGLMPNHVFIIPKGTEQLFFEKNVLLLNGSRHKKNIILASFKDTINSRFFSYLKEISSDKTKNVFIIVRLAFPEEERVIRVKLNGERNK